MVYPRVCPKRDANVNTQASRQRHEEAKQHSQPPTRDLQRTVLGLQSSPSELDHGRCKIECAVSIPAGCSENVKRSTPYII